MMRVKEEDKTLKNNNLKQLKSMLLNLKNQIDEIKNLEVGDNINTKSSAYDIVLIVDVESERDLNRYRVHHDHLKVLDYMKTLELDIAVVDYLF